LEDIWFQSALWIGLALAAALISLRLGIAVAMIEIVVGAVAGNLIGLEATEWVIYLAAVGAVLLTFLAGAEIDPVIFRRNMGACFAMGTLSFVVPYVGVLLFARYALGWSWPEAQIAGLAMSTTSVAVVYAVIVESGLNASVLGKIILAGCFITDVATVLVLGIVFAEYDMALVAFGVATAAALILLPRFVPRLFAAIGGRVSEIEIKFLLLTLFLLGGLAASAEVEAILPAYAVGMVLAPYMLEHHDLARRVRVIAFTMFTPFFFLKAGSLVEARVLIDAAGLFLIFLALKMALKFAGVIPPMVAAGFSRKDSMFTALLMSSGLTFGSIVSLFGLEQGIIDREQYTVLVTAVIASGLVPTVIAQIWFQPETPRGQIPG
jgi:Kef-type K+ transport system membrane component KefB